MLLTGKRLQYAPLPAAAIDDWQVATSLITHTSPEIRLSAVQLLSALARQQPTDTTAPLPAASQAKVDAAFLTLCSVVSSDILSAIRMEALEGLSELHHASQTVKQQALSKRALLHVSGAAPAVSSASVGQQQGPAGTTAADTSLLDTAAGAFVHGMEDDVAQVRMAAVAAMLSLGSKDATFAEGAAMLLVDLVSDELLPVRLAALQGLVLWATVQQEAAKRQKLLAHQQQEPALEACTEEMDIDGAQDRSRSSSDGLQQREQQLEAAEGGSEVEEEEGEVPEELEVQGELPSSEVQLNQQQLDFKASSGGNAAPRSAPPHNSSFKKPAKKKRKSDLPSWGTDAQAAAVSALRDKDAQVRNLALQLLQLLPAASMPAIMNVLQGLIVCCERFGQQHIDAALAVVRQLAQQRTVLVAKSSQNLVKLLSRAIPGSSTTGAPTAAHSAVAVQLVSEAVLGTAKLKPQMLLSLYMHLGKADIRQAAVLQPLLAQLEELQPSARQQD